MHAIKVLKEDHARVSALFGTLDTTDPDAPQARAGLFERLARELTVHVIATDNIFLPQVEEAIEDSKRATIAFFEENSDVLAEATELITGFYEHNREITALLEEMDRLEPDDERWKATSGRLRGTVALQFEVAEKLFPEAGAVLEEEDFERIGDLIEHCKGQVRGLAQAKLASSSSLLHTLRA